MRLISFFIYIFILITAFSISTFSQKTENKPESYNEKLYYICFVALEFSDSGVKKLKTYDFACPYDEKYDESKWRSERMAAILTEFAKKQKIKLLTDGDKIFNPPEIWLIVDPYPSREDFIDVTDDFVTYYNNFVKKNKSN